MPQPTITAAWLIAVTESVEAGGQSATWTKPPPYNCNGLTFNPTAMGCCFTARIKAKMVSLPSNGAISQYPSIPIPFGFGACVSGSTSPFEPKLDGNGHSSADVMSVLKSLERKMPSRWTPIHAYAVAMLPV